MQSLKKLLIVPGSCLLPSHPEWIFYCLLGLVLAFLLVHPLLLLVDVVWPLPLRPRSNHFGLVPLTLFHHLLFEAGEVMNVPSSTSLLWMVSYRLQGFGSQSIRRTLCDLFFSTIGVLEMLEERRFWPQLLTFTVEFSHLLFLSTMHVLARLLNHRYDKTGVKCWLTITKCLYSLDLSLFINHIRKYYLGKRRHFSFLTHAHLLTM